LIHPYARCVGGDAVCADLETLSFHIGSVTLMRHIQPPFSQRAAQPPLSVAVIGTGIAGAATAWLLSQTHKVTVFEKDARPGGHTNTVDVTERGRSLGVDTGFIVYNQPCYPNLTALFRHLGVATQASDMSLAVSLEDGAFEYSGSGLSGLFAQPANLTSPRFWRMLRALLAFYKKAPRDLADGLGEELSIADYVAAEGFSRRLWDDHLAPMAGAIWSSPLARIGETPAASFLRFCQNHGLLSLSGRPAWRTVTGGSREYLHRLLAPFGDNLRLATPVRAVERQAGGVTLQTDAGAERFDHVVIAAHGDQALSMLADPSQEEQALLSAFTYQPNRAVLHRDDRLMPRRQAAWSSWNVIARAEDPGERPVCVTYWMNRLQALESEAPLFVTLNPVHAPEPALEIARFDYDHPVFDAAAVAAQKRLWALQGVRNTWFCGSYFGWGFHEDALQSGLAVAEALGGMARPWRVDNPNGRIAAVAPESAALMAEAGQ